jgi:hypothetical protein
VNRAVKIVLLSLGALAGIVGLFVWDTVSRAERAIEENESRLAADIAALRARYPSRKPLEHALTFEMGHRRQIYATSDLKALPSPAGLPGSPGELLAAAKLTEELLHEGGYSALLRRGSVAIPAVRLIRKAMQKNRFTPDDYRRFAADIDALLAFQPTDEEIVQGEQFLDRRDVLDVIRGRSDPSGALRRRPGWKELFSWRVLVAKALAQLDDAVRDVQAKRSVDLRLDDPPETVAVTWIRRSSTLLPYSALRIRGEWIFTRAVVAIAGFKAATGRLPATLDEAGVAVRETGNRRLRYSEGRLTMSETALSWPEKED